MLHIIAIFMTLAVVSMSACHKSDKIQQIPNDTPATAPTGVAAPAPETRGITPDTTSGAVTLSTVNSKFHCKVKKDCTFTKFTNAPKNESECACQTPCEPFIVNQTEKNIREASNKKLCDPNDWFGDECPAPACNFIEFDEFKCVDGLCVGIDMDGK